LKKLAISAQGKPDRWFRPGLFESRLTESPDPEPDPPTEGVGADQIGSNFTIQ
jgi:hypothetical protein